MEKKLQDGKLYHTYRQTFHPTTILFKTLLGYSYYTSVHFSKENNWIVIHGRIHMWTDEMYMQDIIFTSNVKLSSLFPLFEQKTPGFSTNVPTCGIN